MRDNNDIICGRNAVLEAIRSGNTVDKILILEGKHDGPTNTILREAKKNKIYFRYFNLPRIDNRLRITIGTDEEMKTVVKFLQEYLKNA